MNEHDNFNFKQLDNRQNNNILRHTQFWDNFFLKVIF